MLGLGRFMSSSSVGRRSFSAQTFTKPPMKVAITGSAGNIGYALAFRVASGHLLGPDQPVILHCLELPGALGALKGVSMELEDCAFPLLKGIVQTDSTDKAFEDIDVALLVGSKPRGPGMERADLLKDNGAIFTKQGKSLNQWAKKSVRVVVVGNPANTNCLIAASNAPDIDPRNFTAMTRLDHNRAVAQIIQKTGVDISAIKQVSIWGNHSATQFPDLFHATIGGKPALSVINDEAWMKNQFIPDVQQRGAAIIKARGASSAASAANGAIDHMRDWILGSNGEWVSMAIPSDSDYGIGAGVYFSYPCICENGQYRKVTGLKMNEFAEERMQITKNELFDERDTVAHLLK